MLQQASLPGLIRMLLILALIYYGVKILSRLFAPALLRYVAKKAEKRFGQQFNTTQNQQRNPKKEGETTIDKSPNQNKSSNNDVGEYVDYEEVD